MKTKGTLLAATLALFVLVGAGCAAGPSLSLSKTAFSPGETISVEFTALDSYADNAWIGIIPSDVAHGDEAFNDQFDIDYKYLDGKTSGTLNFVAPEEPGAYDFRMHDTDTSGKEVASVSFTVAQ